MSTNLSLIYGFYESSECPEEMIQFNIALGATEEEARKKATKATIEFSPDPQETGGIIYQVIHGNPMSVYRQPLQFGKPTKTLRSGKPVQVTYTVHPFQEGDSVTTMSSDFFGIENPLEYHIEYNFVEAGFLIVCATGTIRAKRWYQRVLKRTASPEVKVAGDGPEK